VPQRFTPRAGPPDSLRVIKAPIPKTPALLETRFLERAVEKEPPEARRLEELADRYHVTNALARMIHEVALDVGLDPELGFRLIRVESVFDPGAIGAGGATGLCQIMPGTARDLDPKVDTRKELADPRTNLRLGLGYLRDMIERYEKHGDDAVRLGVIAYNRGEIAVDRALRRGVDPENGYGQRILGPRAHGGQPYRGRGIIPRRELPRADSTTSATAASR
jgi:soluble lytic murein transglycosylase-like protein